MMVERWIVRPMQLLFDWSMRGLVEVPERWLIVAAGFIIAGLLAVMFAIMGMRLSRRLKKAELLICELQPEIDRLRQAEERRALADLKSNNAFLQNLALELADHCPTVPHASDPVEDLNKAPDPVRFKLPSIG
jgi:hypothetical protein